MAYSKDMREAALNVYRSGYSREFVTRIFGLGINTLRSWEKLEQETGSLKTRPLNRSPRKINREALLKYCEENPLATHKEAASFFNCTESGIRHAKKALGITRKKRQSNIQNEMNRNESSSSKR
jgi:transposase